MLIKALGKCTTDHISMAGPWLKFRATCRTSPTPCIVIGAINAETEATNAVTCQLDGVVGKVPDVGRKYRDAGVKWVVVGDKNYGEGSSREHAALEPRHLGGVAILVRSFARIHETNLKKQGMLPLTFADPSDYDKITGNDKISILGLGGLKEGSNLTLRVSPKEGAPFEIVACHTFNPEQIEWFKAGSALNAMKVKMAEAPKKVDADPRRRVSRREPGICRRGGRARRLFAAGPTARSEWSDGATGPGGTGGTNGERVRTSARGPRR